MKSVRGLEIKLLFFSKANNCSYMQKNQGDDDDDDDKFHIILVTAWEEE